MQQKQNIIVELTLAQSL